MQLKYIVLITITLFLFTQCQQNAPKTEEIKTDRVDHHSFAQPSKVVTKHLDLTLKVDFETKILAEKAQYTLENNESEDVILGTRDLNIEKVAIGGK